MLKTEWKEWFAWHPVKVAIGQSIYWRTYRYVWLRRVNRRKVEALGGFGVVYVWEYKPCGT